VKPDWPQCGKVLGPRKRCTGARVGDGAYCWAHLDPGPREEAVAELKPGGDLDLRGTEVTPRLLEEILRGLADDRVIRIGKARCQKAVFTGHVNFTKMTVGGGASFNMASFAAGVTFTEAKFVGEADFSAATFGGDSVFAGIEFISAASFIGAQFDRLRLSGVSAATVSFTNARVAGEFTMDPACAVSTLTLDGLRATGPVDVRARVSKLMCLNAEFTERTRFRLTGTRLWLADTVFAQPATVESAADLVTVRTLQGVDAEHLTLANADLSRCLISGLLRPEELRIEGRCVFASTPRGLRMRYGCLPWRWTVRDTLYEELLWRARHQVPRLGWSLPDDDPDADPGEMADAAGLDAARLAVLYRQLRRAVEDARNEPGAADLYYGEMEMRRLSTRRWDERTLLTVYWLVSGYGLRGSRAMLMLAALLVVAAEVLQRAGFPGSPHGYMDYLLYASASALSLDLNGHLPGTLTDWGQVVRMVLRVAGPVLLGLGALAVRGRVKR
jgi:uncharacterized protein YjbI with pentapeptide repeats